MASASLPTGMVTLLFTDIEGSTRLIEELGEEGYVQALAEHRRRLRRAFSDHRGVEVDTQGDAFLYAFADPAEALAAAAQGQQALAPGPVNVRIGLHTGELRLTGEGYAGRELHRAARIAASGHGGQVVLSAATQALVEGDLTELGEHRLKDFSEPVRLFQLGQHRFPPLKTISNTNLPRPASTFVGRQEEREQLVSLLRDGTRLVTLCGPGGSGKTRLALEAAGELVPTFGAGVFWVGLAALRQPALVTETIAQTLGAKDDLADHIAERNLLLLLDNFEHVVDAAPEIGRLLEQCPQLRLMVTSREPLRVSGEFAYPVPPLAEPEAVELFCQRSRTEPDETVAELCRRLDHLPLALELAAARASVLSPRQILERLSQRLDLLKGGRDVDPRQRTLRATIDWSHGLLDEDERDVFARFAVFRGGCGLDAAEEVAGASLDSLQSLVDKSLLRHSAERFWMLETIREYARERLDDRGETAKFALRHAHHYLAELEERRPLIFGPRRSALLAWYGEEEDNLRAALERLEDVSPADAGEMANLLGFYWSPRGQLREGRQRIRDLLATESVPVGTRASLLATLAECEERLGDHAAALDAATEAIDLAEETRDRDALGLALYTISRVALTRGDLQQATSVLTRALEEGSEDEWTRALLLAGLGAVHVEAGRDDEARDAFRRARAGFRAAGDEANESACAIGLAELNVYSGDFEEAAAVIRPVLEWTGRTGDRYRRGGALYALGLAELGRGHPVDARTAFAEALEVVLDSERTGSMIFGAILSAIALASDSGSAWSAARLLGAAERLSDDGGFVRGARELELQERFRQPLMNAVSGEIWRHEHVAGGCLSLEETIALARELVRGSRSSSVRA